MEEQFKSYVRKNDEDIDLIKKVLFGDTKIDEIGMKKQVDEMYQILVSSKKIEGGLKWLFGWVLLFAAAMLILKGWWLTLLTYLFK